MQSRCPCFYVDLVCKSESHLCGDCYLCDVLLHDSSEIASLLPDANSISTEPAEQTLKYASRQEDSKQSKEPSKPVVFKDECTAFLSNVAFEVSGIIPSQ